MANICPITIWREKLRVWINNFYLCQNWCFQEKYSWNIFSKIRNVWVLDFSIFREDTARKMFHLHDCNEKLNQSAQNPNLCTFLTPQLLRSQMQIVLQISLPINFSKLEKFFNCLAAESRLFNFPKLKSVFFRLIDMELCESTWAHWYISYNSMNICLAILFRFPFQPQIYTFFTFVFVPKPSHRGTKNFLSYFASLLKFVSKIFKTKDLFSLSLACIPASQ